MPRQNAQISNFIKRVMVIKMRIDKFLKVSRIIKRRTVANGACDAEHVSVNGRPVKASYDVKENDLVEITFGQRSLVIKVLDVREHALKADASSMYEVIEQKTI